MSKLQKRIEKVDHQVDSMLDRNSVRLGIVLVPVVVLATYLLVTGILQKISN